MRTLPIVLLVLVAGTAQSQEQGANATTAPGNEQASAIEQLNARIAGLKAQLEAVNSGRATPVTPFAMNPRIWQLGNPTAKPANATPALSDNCAIPLVTAKPDPGINFTMRRYAPDVDRMAPLPQIKAQVCNSSPR